MTSGYVNWTRASFGAFLGLQALEDAPPASDAIFETVNLYSDYESTEYAHDPGGEIPWEDFDTETVWTREDGA